MAPKDIGMDGDVSLGAVLDYAQQQNLQFGPELLYTYGPLGFLIFFYYSPYLAGLKLFTHALLCYAVASGLCLVAWRLRLAWRCLMLACFIFAASNFQPRTDLVLDTGFFCWGLLCFLESGRRLTIYAGVFAVFAAFAGLAKTSFLFLGGVSVLLLAVDLWSRKQARLSLAMATGYLLTLVLCWLSAGQNLVHFGEFLLKSLAIVEAYNQSLGWEGLPTVRRTGLVLLCLALGVLVTRTLAAFGPDEPRPWPRRVLLFAWIFLLTFAFWKHSFVREDSFHPLFFLAFAPVLVFGLETLPSAPGRLRLAARCLSLPVVGLSLAALQMFYFPAFRQSLAQPLRAALLHFQCLFAPAEYHRVMGEAVEACRQEAQLPGFGKRAGTNTVDSFGYRQVYALFNGMNYRPRPVFQSYAACSDRLARWNEQFYLSHTAPDYVVFSLNAVDRKFPPLEDARTLRALLVNYEMADNEGDFLLLKRRSSEAPKLRLLAEGTLRPGEPLDLRPHGESDLWVELELKTSVWGRLREMLFRLPTVRLAAWQEPGKGLLLRRRATGGMMAAGFVASPLLASTRDVRERFTGDKITRPGAFSVEISPVGWKYWQKNLAFRVYQIGDPQKRENATR